MPCQSEAKTFTPYDGFSASIYFMPNIKAEGSWATESFGKFYFDDIFRFFVLDLLFLLRKNSSHIYLCIHARECF